MPYLSLADVASRLNVTRPTLSRLVRAGEFVRPIRIGRQYRFNPADVEDWERRQRALDANVPAFEVGAK